MPYAVLSDIHAHSFTLFSKTEADGTNSRLRIILNEMKRAADELVKVGGTTMVISGDIMHTRGQIDPEVLNPLRETINSILGLGVTIYAIPGNHDLKSAETNELSSSIQNLVQIHNTGGEFFVYNEAEVKFCAGFNLGFVPWHNTKEGLLTDLEKIKTIAGAHVGVTDVFIHAGIDGVLSGMPAHGLTSTELAAFGFRRVFAGHYHNHKDFGDGVVSVGATTHHNWGDVGTRAGFLIVDEKTGAITHHASEAPRFVDISGMPEEDLLFAVPGNYVRLRGAAMTEDEIKAMRSELLGLGALATSIEVPRTTTVLRPAAAAKAITIEQSIEAYVKSAPPASVDPALVVKRAIEVLHESQAVED